MYSPEVLEILKWVAIGHEVPITDSDGDQYGEECIFAETCEFNTTQNRKEHAATCLQTLARAELARIDKTLRQYRIEFTFTDTPTESYIRRVQQWGKTPEIKHISQSREIWTLEKLKFNVQEFIKREIAFHIRYWAAPQDDWTVVIDPASITIHPPVFFYK
jgi:hypothetical protein